MAKKSKADEVEQVADEIQYIETGAELQDALSKMFAEAGTSEVEVDAVAHVYLVEGSEEPKIWKGAPSEYDLDKLAREHGSGQYRLKVYVKNDDGRFSMRLNRVFPYRLSAEQDARLKAIRSGAAQPAANGGTILTAADVAKIVADALAVRAAPAIDPLALLERVAGIFAKSTPAPAAPVATGGNPVEMAISLVRLSKELQGDSEMRGGRTSAGDVALLKGVDFLGKMAEKHFEQQGGAVAQPVAQDAKQDLLDNLTPDQREELEMLHLALRQAVRAAKRGEDADEFAMDNYEFVPLELIASMHNDPKWFDILCGNVPECANHRPWFEKVRAKLISEAQEAGELTADGKIVETPGNGTIDAGTGNDA